MQAGVNLLYLEIVMIHWRALCMQDKWHMCMQFLFRVRLGPRLLAKGRGLPLLNVASVDPADHFARIMYTKC